MNNTQFAMSLLLLVIVFGVAASYYVTTQRMLHMRREMEKLQAQARVARASGILRNERARCHLELQSLEAQLTVNNRTALSADELDEVNLNQKTVKNCVDALKKADEWLGLPFDLEWADMLERLPRLSALYRASQDNLSPTTDMPATNVLGLKGGSGQEISGLATPISPDTSGATAPTKQPN